MSSIFFVFFITVCFKTLIIGSKVLRQPYKENDFPVNKLKRRVNRPPPYLWYGFYPLVYRNASHDAGD